MNLSALVRKYLELAGGYESPVALDQLGLTQAGAESHFGAWDEDYQISRFMLLSRREEASETFTINGCEYTHVAFRPGIEDFLA